MKLKHILMALIPFIMASACKKQDILLYNSEVSGIYFQTGGLLSSGSTEESYRDSTDFSFTRVPTTTMDTILTRSVRVRTLGKVRDYPRPVKFSVDQANTTAVEGKHFELYYDSVVIPAGSSEAYVPVKFKRTEDMQDSTFSLVLKLEENEHFKVYMETQSSSNNYARKGANIRADKYKFTISDILTPLNWSSTYRTYWGPWTATKFKFINDITGWTPYDWATNSSSQSPAQLGQFDYAAMKVRNALQALADAGTPMLDEDGLGMQLGPNYQVKY